MTHDELVAWAVEGYWIMEFRARVEDLMYGLRLQYEDGNVAPGVDLVAVAAQAVDLIHTKARAKPKSAPYQDKMRRPGGLGRRHRD